MCQLKRYDLPLGRIVPAIGTTTATVAGLVSVIVRDDLVTITSR